MEYIIILRYGLKDPFIHVDDRGFAMVFSSFEKAEREAIESNLMQYQYKICQVA